MTYEVAMKLVEGFDGEYLAEKTQIFNWFKDSLLDKDSQYRDIFRDKLIDDCPEDYMNYVKAFQ